MGLELLLALGIPILLLVGGTLFFAAREALGRAGERQISEEEYEAVKDKCMRINRIVPRQFTTKVPTK